MYPSIFYMLKCLIFKQLLKIANISAKIYINRYIKSLENRKNAVPLYQFLEILIAKTQAGMVLRFRFVCRLSLCYIKTAKRFNSCTCEQE